MALARGGFIVGAAGEGSAGRRGSVVAMAVGQGFCSGCGGRNGGCRVGLRLAATQGFPVSLGVSAGPFHVQITGVAHCAS